MSEIIPAVYEIKGQEFVMTPENTRVYIYRDEPAYNHVEHRPEEGTLLRFFNVGGICMYFSGVEMGEVDEDFDSKDILGWNADTLIADKPTDYIRDRYIKVVAKELDAKHLFVPPDWAA